MPRGEESSEEWKPIEIQTCLCILTRLYWLLKRKRYYFSKINSYSLKNGDCTEGTRSWTGEGYAQFKLGKKFDSRPFNPGHIAFSIFSYQVWIKSIMKCHTYAMRKSVLMFLIFHMSQNMWIYRESYAVTQTTLCAIGTGRIPGVYCDHCWMRSQYFLMLLSNIGLL